MTKVQAHELRTKSKAELNKKLEELRRELLSLRVKQQSNQTSFKSMEIRYVRRSIARVLTVINQGQKAALRKQYAGKKYKPLDLRPKKTRAMRRALTKTQRNKKTPRAVGKLRQFPKQKYFVLA